MKFVSFNDNWSPAVKALYEYDLLEIFRPLNKKMRHYQLSYQNRRDIVLSFLKKNGVAVDTIIDVGAAQGNFSLPLAEEGFKVTWNDIRPEILEYVQAKYEYGRVDYLVGNIFDLDSDKRFDCVLITEIIEHVAHPDQFLACCRKLLTPKGIIIVTTPNGSYFRNKLPKFSDCLDPSVYESNQFKPDSDGHIFLLHPEEIQQLAMSSDLEVLEIQFFNNFITSGHLKTRFLLRFLPNSIIICFEKISRRIPLRLRAKIHAQSFAVLKQS